MPFILRGVKLLGIDSGFCSMEERRLIWHRLATDMRPTALRAIAKEITMSELPQAFDTLLKGAARGRFVVKLW